MDPRCEIKGNFGISYAHFNVNDPTKAIIYNHAYKYNSNKRAVAGFLGYPQPCGGAHPPIPREGVLGEVLGG